MVEYFNDTHQYLVDGIIVPSVSQLTAYALKEDMSAIPEATLNKAAEFGTHVHELIEDYESGLSTYQFAQKGDAEILDGWIELVKENKIETLMMENIVHTEDYAGRYDIIGMVNGEETLIDIKTNSVYPKDHLEVQMGLYLNAMSKDMPCACAWYNKTKGTWQLKKVFPISREKAQEIIEAHKEGKEPPVLHEIGVAEELYTPEETAKIKAFYALKKEVEEIEKKRKEWAIEMMKHYNAKTWENEDFKITFIEATTKTTVDSDKLKRDGLYNDYTKQVKVKETIKVTHKWLEA